MHLSKKQWFGIITFVILLIAAYLVTKEPWRTSSDRMGSSLSGSPPEVIHLDWKGLSSAYPHDPGIDSIYSYRGFDLAYNEAYEQAAWVVYVLTRNEITTGNIPRTDEFRVDTVIRTGSSNPDDYRGSGYDRGHLAPAGDMKWDPLSMDESFLMSNISPQLPSFNRGIWRKLEARVREWALEKDSLFVVTGPVLHRIDTTIGPNEVGVPSHYFKVLWP